MDQNAKRDLGGRQKRAPSVGFSPLAAHERLKDEPATITTRWVQVNLNAVTARLVLGVCISIAKRARARAREVTVPSGFKIDPDIQYFGKNFNFLPTDPNLGLSCATFVLALFRRADVEMLNVREWLERTADESDKEIQRKIAESFEIAFGKEVGKILLAQVGSPRIRPEQVAVAAGILPKPVGFEIANSLGQSLLETLKRSYDAVEQLDPTSSSRTE